ncbi:hypothetical protein L1887_11289 [Cichorium endivia]|nr:hypothetical protein L1887_11289 [Cichorium endivia]
MGLRSISRTSTSRKPRLSSTSRTSEPLSDSRCGGSTSITSRLCSSSLEIANTSNNHQKALVLILCIQISFLRVQQRSQQLNDKPLIRCKYTMASFSTGDRMRKPKGDRLLQDLVHVLEFQEICKDLLLQPGNFRTLGVKDISQLNKSRTSTR